MMAHLFTPKTGDEEKILREMMEIKISITSGNLVTHYGKRPFRLPSQCPVCGEAMRLRQMDSGTPYSFKLECSCCFTEISIEADES